MKKTVLLVLLVTGLLLPNIVLRSEGVSKTYHDLMGTQISIKLYDGTLEQLNHIEDIYELYSQLSTNFRRNEVASSHAYYNLENIYTINQNAGIAPVEVKKELIDLLIYAVELTGETEGYFNIGIGKAVDIWKGLIENYRSGIVPEEVYNQALTNINTLEPVDLNKIIINEQEKTVYIEDSSVKLDLGAIAKGYATKEVVNYLEAEGVKKYSINAGNSSLSVGVHFENRAFNIGLIDTKNTFSNGIIGIVKLKDLSISTSGNSEQYTTYNGEYIHHIINPFDLMPKNYYISISLVGDDAALLEGYSTAVFSMELDEAISFLEEKGLKYVIYGVEKEVFTNMNADEFELAKRTTNAKGNLKAFLWVIGSLVVLFGGGITFLIIKENKNKKAEKEAL